ncbi:MAG: GNAT family N-acetyltransferase [Eggerthellaceae bacterium]|nr:GNAT family N-acetyltransferase [Eggerthellaceae bacterium]
MAKAEISIREASVDDLCTLNYFMELEDMESIWDVENTYVAINSFDEIVGTIRIELDEEHRAYIHPIVVYESWRGIGVGTDLVNYAQEIYGELRLVSRKESLGFYESLGSVSTGWDDIYKPIASECLDCSLIEGCGPRPLRIPANSRGTLSCNACRPQLPMLSGSLLSIRASNAKVLIMQHKDNGWLHQAGYLNQKTDFSGNDARLSRK